MGPAVSLGSSLVATVIQISTSLLSEQQESEKDSTFHEENMIMSTADLFLAGTDTTAATLRWGLIHMMDHPDVQGDQK